MQNKKVLLACLSGLLALLIIIVTVCGVLYIKGNDKADISSVYSKQLQLGNQYADSKDYDQAIAAFRAAVELDPDNDEPYYLLAQALIADAQFDEAKNVLIEGINRTSSEKLLELYNRYFTAENKETQEADVKASEYSFNTAYCTVIANYTYEDYQRRYQNMSFSNVLDTCSAVNTDLGATLVFFDEGENRVVDPDTKRPFNDVRPNYLVFNGLVKLFSFVSEDTEIGIDELDDMGAVGIKTGHDTKLGSFVAFEYQNCIYEIAINSENKFNMKSDNRISSVYGTGTTSDDEDTTFDGTIVIINATDAKAVPDAVVEIYNAEELPQDVLICEVVSDANGKIALSLAAGRYNAYFECEGYVSEKFEFTVYETGNYSADTFTVSPDLVSGETRIVLEWGEFPSDLDLHLTAPDGSRVYFSSKTMSVDGRIVADLDVDDTTSFGPETITVYDAAMDFTIYVNDFTGSGVLNELSDVTVKVYLSDGSIRTFEPSSMNTAGETNVNTWAVFSVNGGRLIEHNYACEYVGGYIG